MTFPRVASLTLDVELDHHDLVAPHRFAQALADVATWDWLSEVSHRFQAPLTAFVVAQLLEMEPELAGWLRATCVEIALHSYSHRPEVADSLDEIRQGKAVLRACLGVEPVGYRAPLGLITPEGWHRLQQESFRYDSSVYPTLRLGRFNNLRATTGPVLITCNAGGEALVELPLAALSRSRVMFSVSYVKLFGLSLYRRLLAWDTLPAVVVIDCHLHDLTFATVAYDHLPPLWKVVYGRNRHGGKAALWWMLAELQARGYEFWPLAQVAAAVREGHLAHD